MGDVVQALRPTTKQATPAADPLLLKHREMVLRYIEGAMRGMAMGIGLALIDIDPAFAETQQNTTVACLQSALEAASKYFDALGAKA